MKTTATSTTTPVLLDRMYADLAEVQAGLQVADGEAARLSAAADAQIDRLTGERDAAVEAGDVAAHRRASHQIADMIRCKDLADHDWSHQDPEDPTVSPDWSADASPEHPPSD